MVVEKLKDETDEQTSKKKFMFQSLLTCPPSTPFTTVASLVLLVALLYGTLWGFMGDIALPGGAVFGLFVLVVVCYLGGQLVRLIKVPSLVGMMVLGFTLRNAPYIDVANDIPDDWASNIRNIALVLILLRAGLEVDSDILKRSKSTCARLILVPFVVEFVTGAVISHYLLDLSWMFAFLAGFMLSAVSPAVVLPVMIKLQKKGIGVTNGIPTLVIAVAGIDDVLALTGFEIILGITFSTGSLEWTIGKGIIEIIIGVVYGVIMGLICWYIPHPDERSKNIFRVTLLTFGGTFIMFGSMAANYSGAGALGCIFMPFVAAINWKKQDWDDEDNPISGSLAFVWRIVEPFLFGLIGSEIRIKDLHPSIIGLGLATLFIGLALRMVASLIATYKTGMTLKEQIFVTFAGLPKATVQAAIGPVVWTLAKKSKSGPEIEEFGVQILTVAVLSILITAPLGATAIALLAPRLLDNDNKEKDSGIADKSKEVKPDEYRRKSIFDVDSNIYTVVRL